MRTAWANTLYNISYMFYFKSLWYFYHGDLLLFQAKCLAALQARKMHVLALFVWVVPMIAFVAAVIVFGTAFVFLTDTVFMLPATVIDDVQQLFL